MADNPEISYELNSNGMISEAAATAIQLAKQGNCEVVMTCGYGAKIRVNKDTEMAHVTQAYACFKRGQVQGDIDCTVKTLLDAQNKRMQARIEKDMAA